MSSMKIDERNISSEIIKDGVINLRPACALLNVQEVDNESLEGQEKSQHNKPNG